MDIHNRARAFLFASFLSYFGDALLLYSLPTGLGISSGDVRATILMFLIPGISILLSTLLTGKIESREHSSRQDFAKLLSAIGVIELVLGTLAISTNNATIVAVICCAFVAFYAFAKEGVPRLLYAISIHRYFSTDETYNKLLALDFVGRVFAYLLGGITASYLLREGIWKWSMFIDAGTFFAYASVIYFLGKTATSEQQIAPRSEIETDKVLQKTLNAISVAVPTFTLIACLYLPYITVLANDFSIMSVDKGVLSTIGISIPAMILGRYLSTRGELQRFKHLIVLIPATFVAASIAFLAFPAMATMFIALAISALYYNVFAPIDYSFRNKLPRTNLINFNTAITRRFAIAQTISCILAFIFHSFGVFRPASLISVGVVATGLLVIGSSNFYKFGRPSS